MIRSPSFSAVGEAAGLEVGGSFLQFVRGSLNSGFQLAMSIFAGHFDARQAIAGGDDAATIDMREWNRLHREAASARRITLPIEKVDSFN